jgi:23S rRNA pseudouridine955/2504/2580 synthase/23S rRNA pseudouridine1911/1915/1917 synthase
MKIEEFLIFENEDFIVLNKPEGILSIPDREGKLFSLKNLLQEKYAQVFTVHRLDKETTGLIIFAKNKETHKYFSQQFENRVTEKIYLGLILGSLTDKTGSINAPIAEHPTKKGLMIIHSKGKSSITDYKVLHDFGIFSWVQFQIHTGRTHQIRVHMKSVGHPIVCDKLYGDGKPFFLSSIKHNYKLSKNAEEEIPILNRLALHSHKLKICDAKNKTFEFEAPLSKDLHASLQQLSKRKKSNNFL